MKEINNLLKNNNITYRSLRKINKVIILDNKYVIKKNNNDIYKYLEYRNFNNYPRVIKDENYDISEYIEDIEIPSEQKMIDLIDIVGLLHKKTIYYKKITEYNISNIYDEIKNQLEDIKKYYDDTMLMIESTIFMSPSQYLLARNISYIYKIIIDNINKLEIWYKKINDIKKVRVSIIHNNLNLDHLINNKLISWNNSKIGMPIYDLVKLYRNTYNEYDWIELLNRYEENYKLKEEELYLFTILISIPNKIYFNNIEIDNVIEVNNELNYLKITDDFISNKNFKNSEDKTDEK